MDKEREILRDKLRNYTPEPSRDLWSGIEAGIRKKKRKLPVWMWMAAAAVIALLMTVWLWPREEVLPQEMNAETHTPTEVPIDTVAPTMPLNQSMTTAEQADPLQKEDITTPKQADTEVEPTSPQRKIKQKPVPKKPSSPKPAPKQNLAPKNLLTNDTGNNKTSEVKPKLAQFASNQPNDPKPTIMKLSQLKEIETQQGEQVTGTFKKPTKVVIIRKAKPKKTKKKNRSFELNIGNTNLLRITRKRNTTEQTTS